MKVMAGFLVTPTNEQTIILNTTDGGNSWNYQFNEPTGALYSIFFVDENNGWATGNYGIILHTSNGGASWNYQISGATFTLFDVFFTDINNGWITGSGPLSHYKRW